MSVSRLVTLPEIRLLNAPWGSMEDRSWNAQALKMAQKLQQQWERYYPDHLKKMRHHDPDAKPIIPTFNKVDADLIAPMLALGVQSCDLALHFVSRMIQATVLNASRISYEKTMFYLRKVAECWQNDKPELLRAIKNINAFKMLVVDRRPAHEIWRLLVSIEPKASTWVHREFMSMLMTNSMLDYEVQPPALENSIDLLWGEKPFPENKFSIEEPAPATLEKKTLLLTATTHNHQMVVPILWEGSIIKLLAEFASLAYVLYDIPPMNPEELTGEVLRRLEHYTNNSVKTRTSSPSYTTPYVGFYHHHMHAFNNIVANALAVPNGVDTNTIRKEGAIFRSTEHILRRADQKTYAALQWPFRIKHAYIFDGENNAWAFEMDQIIKRNEKVDTPHVSWSDMGLFYYPDCDIQESQVKKLLQAQWNGGRQPPALSSVPQTVEESLKNMMLATTNHVGVRKVPPGDIKKLTMAQGQFRRSLRYNRRPRNALPSMGTRVYQAWPTGPLKGHGKRGRDAVACRSGIPSKKSRSMLHEESFEKKVLDLSQRSVFSIGNDTPRPTKLFEDMKITPTSGEVLTQRPQMVDLTLDDSDVQVSLHKMEEENPNQSIPEVPSQASFSKTLEDRPSTSHSTPAKPDNLNASYSHGETTSDLDLTDYGRPKANPKRQLSEINEDLQPHTITEMLNVTSPENAVAKVQASLEKSQSLSPAQVTARIEAEELPESLTKSLSKEHARKLRQVQYDAKKRLRRQQAVDLMMQLQRQNEALQRQLAEMSS